jgi:hypothetical protein
VFKALKDFSNGMEKSVVMLGGCRGESFRVEDGELIHGHSSTDGGSK